MLRDASGELWAASMKDDARGGGSECFPGLGQPPCKYASSLKHSFNTSIHLFFDEFSALNLVKARLRLLIEPFFMRK